MNTKKKILIRIGSMQGGGAEKVLLTLLRNISKEKYDIQLLLNSKRGIYLSRIPKTIEIKHIVLGDDQLSHLSRFSYLIYKVYRRLKAEYYAFFPKRLYGNIIDARFDIEIAFLQDISTQIIKSPNKDSKKIVWIHDDLKEYQESNPNLLSAITNSLAQFDRIVCVSNGATEVVKKILPDALNHKCLTIYNPIDVQKVRSNSISAHKLFQGNKIAISVIGRLSMEKGCDRIPIVAKELKDKGICNFCFYLIGDGPMRAFLENQIKKLNLSDCVKLLGYKSPVYPYMKQSNIILIPSRYEGFSLVVAESRILLKKVISTRTAGPVELLKNTDGEIVENSIMGISNSLEKVLTSPNKLNSSSSKNKDYFPFEVSLVVKKVESLFDTICAE